MATSSLPIATCACRHTCDTANGLLQRASTNVPNDENVQIAQGTEKEIRAKLLTYQEENIRLRSVIHDVTEVNKRWQKYNQERVGYVQKLLSTIKDLQQTEASATDSNLKCVREEADLRARHEGVNLENTVLRKELDECEKSYRHLNVKMDLAKHEFVEQLQVVEMQMKMHKDDWEAEKREKEDAKKMSDRLKHELEGLKAKLSDVQKQASKPTKSTVVYVCMCENHSQDNGFVGCRVVDSLKRQTSHGGGGAIQVLPCQNLVSRPMPVSNGIEITKLRPPPLVDHENSSSKCRGLLSSSPPSLSSSCSSTSSASPPYYVVDSTTPDINCDHGRTGTGSGRLKGVIQGGGNATVGRKCVTPSGRPATWKLICPKCRRVFPSNLHLQFTSHIDECQENMHTCSQ